MSYLTAKAENVAYQLVKKEDLQWRTSTNATLASTNVMPSLQILERPGEVNISFYGGFSRNVTAGEKINLATLNEKIRPEQSRSATVVDGNGTFVGAVIVFGAGNLQFEAKVAQVASSGGIFNITYGTNGNL